MSDHLRHASADPNYDPAKAHDYYIRNRELKGRESNGEYDAAPAYNRYLEKMSGLKNKTPEAETATKKTQPEVKAGPSTSTKAKAKTKALKAKGAAVRTKLKAKVENYAKKEAESIAARLRIEKDTQSKIDALPAVASNVSPAQRKALLAARQNQVDKIVKAAEAQYEKLDPGQKEKAQPVAKKVTKKTSSKTKKKKQALTDLKTKVSKAREAYEKLKKEYETKSEDTTKKKE